MAWVLIVTLVGVGWTDSGFAGEDAGAAFPFTEGDVVGLDRVDALRPYLPEELWANRQFYFYEGMQMEIGPSRRDYAPAAAYLEKSKEFHGIAKIGPGGSMEGFKAGQAFAMDEIDCASDPDAGVKVMWSFATRWSGDGGALSFLYSYWDRGERLPLFYEGDAKAVILSHRVEPQFWEGSKEGNLLRKTEKRTAALGVEVDAPPEYRGTMLLSYRYKDAAGPPFESTGIDTWVYVPTLRRVRRISGAQRTDAIAGTDFSMEDANSFDGIIPEFEWECLGTMDVLAPVNTKVKAYPFDKDHSFGPFGLSFADDRWELRPAVKVRFHPKDESHPYQSKIIYLDRQTMKTLYSFAYDRKGDLWKMIMHNGRWSGDHPDSFPGWPGVPEPNVLMSVGDVIVNVQTGSGNRIEFWNAHSTPFLDKRGNINRGKIKRYINVGRLTTGR